MVENSIMVKVVVGTKNVINIGIMVSGFSMMVRVFWVHGDLIYKNKRVV